MRKWFQSILDEACSGILSQLVRIEKALESLAVVTQAHGAQLDRIEQALLVKSSDLSISEQGGPTRSSDDRPFATTRSSWPRMKKMLEEREVRKNLDHKQSEDHEMTQGRQMNRQTQAVADYWIRKVEQQQEGS